MPVLLAADTTYTYTPALRVRLLLLLLLRAGPLLPDEVDVERGLLLAAAPQHVAAHEPRQVPGDLVADEVALAHGEDQVQVLERPPLGLLDEEEYQDEGEQVEGGEQA